jgi:hypothetical protein
MMDALQNEDTKEAECYSTLGLSVKYRVIRRMSYSTVTAAMAPSINLLLRRDASLSP